MEKLPLSAEELLKKGLNGVSKGRTALCMCVVYANN